MKQSTRPALVRRLLPGALILAILLAATAAPAGWLAEQRLTYAPAGSTTFVSNVRCAASSTGQDVHIVWYESRGDTSRIFYRRFDGAIWTPAEQVTSPPASASKPSLGVGPDDVIHLVWEDSRRPINTEIYYSSYDGAGWTPEVRLTQAAGNSQEPDLALGPEGQLHLVWTDLRDGNKEIYYKMFDGATWSADLRLTADSAASVGPRVAVDLLGKVHVAWYDSRDGYSAIYYKVFDGAAWSQDQRLTWDSDLAENPFLAIDTDGKVHLFWDDNRTGSFSIYHKTYDGVAWSADECLCPGSLLALAPWAARGPAGQIHIVWFDQPTADVASEICYRRFDGSAWEPTVRLTEAAGTSWNPVLTPDRDGNLHVFWHDGRHSATNEEIYWRWWYNGTPPEPEILSVDPPDWPTDESTRLSLTGSNLLFGAEVWLASGGRPQVAVSDVAVQSGAALTCNVSLGCVAPGAWDVIVRNLDGQTDTLPGGFLIEEGLWGEQNRLTTDPGTANLSYPNARSIVADAGGNPQVVWYDDRSGRNEIYYKRFDGMAWGPDQRLSSGTGLSQGPAIAIGSDGKIHVAWADNRDGDWEIYYKCWAGSWSDDLRLTAAAGNSGNVSIAVDSRNRVHAVWDDKRDGNYEIYYKWFDGSAWRPDERLTTTGSGSQYASIAVGPDDKLHVIWREDFLSPDQIRYKYFDGSAWSATEIIAPSSYCVTNPSLTVDAAGMLHVVWDNDPPGYSGGPNSDVFYIRRGVAGWGPITRLTIADLKSRWATAAVAENGSIYLVWSDQRDGNFEIYYKLFDGTAWRPDVRLTSSANESWQPACAIDRYGRVHLIWTDKRDGDFEIYYRMRDPSPGAGVVGGGGLAGAPSAVRAAPNPASGGMVLEFDSVPPGDAAVSIYDTAGRLVWESGLRVASSGECHLVWDCSGCSGDRVSPGIYFVRFNAAGRTASGKVVVLR